MEAKTPKKMGRPPKPIDWKKVETKKKKMHGKAKINGKRTPTYLSWASMIARCTNKKINCYEYYGAKNISFCDEWNTYINFFNDMGERPQGTTLDRIDNNRGYSKENCRWSTYKNQAENRSTTAWIEFNGEKRSTSDWARFIGIPRTTLRLKLSQGLTLANFLEAK